MWHIQCNENKLSFKVLAGGTTRVAPVEERNQIIIQRDGRRDKSSGTCKGKKTNYHLRSG